MEDKAKEVQLKKKIIDNHYKIIIQGDKTFVANKDKELLKGSTITTYSLWLDGKRVSVTDKMLVRLFGE